GPRTRASSARARVARTRMRIRTSPRTPTRRAAAAGVLLRGPPSAIPRAPVVRVRPSRLASVVEVVRVEAPDREAVRRPPGLPPPPTHPAASAGAPPPAPPELMSVRHVRLRPQLSALPVRGGRPRADFPAAPRARV